jgi:predicted DsbA family dithiol-disulfide isomerase
MDDVTKTKPKLTVDVVSDVVCPWCFIGKRRLEKAIALRPDLDAEVRWHPFFLNPWVPREGIGRETYLKTKFGSVERYAEISKRITAAGAEEQIPFALDKITRQPNTIDCHRLIHWAGLEGNASAVKERLMAMYFIEGADLSDPEMLVRAATDCGLDGAMVRRLLASDADVEEVESEARRASESGIDGVPCFIFGGALAVSGAQAPEYLADAMGRAVQEQSRRARQQADAVAS